MIRNMPGPLLIDTDNALGSARVDVDDGLAIASLLLSGLPVAAVASVGGNTSEREADRNNRALGALCGYTGPYLRGVEAGEVQDRIDRYLRQSVPQGVRIAALGPLTNVAALLRAGLPIQEVVLVGSNASSRGRFPPWWPHEFNLTHDRAAAHAVFASDLPLTIVPLDVARRLRATRRRLDELRGDLGALLREKSRRWGHRSFWVRGTTAFPVFDLVAAAWLTDPELLEVEETTARAHPRLWIEYGKGGRPVRLVRELDEEGIWRRFAERISAGPAEASGSPREAR
jgi:inosine-uridine nucleoside N-ribohydrolase